MLGRVIELNVVDEYTLAMRVKDLNQQVWLSKISRKKFSHLRVGSLGRFRSARLEPG